MTKFEATQKIKKRLNYKTKEEVAIELGISRPTLDARLSFHTWKLAELTLIKTL